MGMKRIEKVGSVSIKVQDTDGRYYLSYWSAITRKTITRKLDTGSLNTARKEAASLAREIAKNNAPMGHVKVRIPDAISTAIENSRSKSKGHRENLKDNARYFQEWLSKSFPGITWWEDVRYRHAYEYIGYLRDTLKVKPKTARNYATIIGITSKHYCRIDGRVYQRIEISHPWLTDTTQPEKRYLSAEESLALLDLARVRQSKNAVIAVALGAFAGLNLWEIARMKVKDIDLLNSTIDIRESKNVHRQRQIPVLPMVVEALWPHVHSADPESFILDSPLEPTDRTISRNIFRRLLPHARKQTGAEFNIAPKDLRKTLINLMGAAGVSDQWMEAYVGHSTYSILRKHYHDQSIVKFREFVLTPLQSYLEKFDTKGKSVGDLIASGEILATEEEYIEKQMEREGVL